MKLQIKKVVALTLVTALSAGVLTLAACKGKNKTDPATETNGFEINQTAETRDPEEAFAIFAKNNHLVEATSDDGSAPYDLDALKEDNCTAAVMMVSEDKDFYYCAELFTYADEASAKKTAAEQTNYQKKAADDPIVQIFEKEILSDVATADYELFEIKEIVQDIDDINLKNSFYFYSVRIGNYNIALYAVNTLDPDNDRTDEMIRLKNELNALLSISQPEDGNANADGSGTEESQFETVHDAAVTALYEAVAAIPIGTGTALTEEELNDIMEALPCIAREAYEINDLSRISPASRFLSTYYADIKDLDLNRFLRYLPWDETGEPSLSDDELIALYGEIPEVFILNKYSVEYVNRLFETYAGIKFTDLNTDYSKPDENNRITYLKEYDALYTHTSDHGECMFAVADGERIGDNIYLYGSVYGSDDYRITGTGESILVLKENPAGGYQFVSLLPANW